MSPKITYPAGAIRSFKDVQALLKADKPVWITYHRQEGFAVSKITIDEYFGNGQSVNRLWNLQGDWDRDNVNYPNDFIFENYWHAYAWCQKVKGRARCEST